MARSARGRPKPQWPLGPGCLPCPSGSAACVGVCPKGLHGPSTGLPLSPEGTRPLSSAPLLMMLLAAVLSGENSDKSC